MDRALYEEHAQLEADHWWFVGRRAIIGAVLARQLPSRQGNTILDVGCGSGGMLPLLAELGSVTGLEGDEQAVEHARETFSAWRVQLGRIPEDVPAAGALDVVTAFDVIEHLDDDVGALAALRAAVRPGGSVVVTVPALPWLWSDHDRASHHRRRYTRRRLVEALRAADLRVAHVSYFNTLLFPAVAGARLAQRARRGPVESHSDFTMPSPWLNGLLAQVLRSERGAVARWGLPIGVSLIAVARRDP
jgi:2-polyprenyl-3-methyl-5-hydroxy-6-metoxy-1,4-benzoquinol methylase